MGFFRQSGRHSPRILWQFTTTGRLWKLVPAAGQFFIGEDRDIETKVTTFFCIDRDTGELRWEELSFTEPWWIGIETIHRDTLLLHEFGNPSLPDHRTIIAIDLRNGTVLWRRDDLRFEAAYDTTVVGSIERFDGRQFVCVDLRTGMAQDVALTEEHLSRYRNTGPEPDTEVEFPVSLLPGSIPPGTVQAALKKEPGIRGGSESLAYLVKGRSLLVSRAVTTHTGDGTPKTIQFFLVIDSTRRRVVFRDVIDDELHLPLPDPFFMISSMIYYVKNKRTLTAVALAERTPAG